MSARWSHTLRRTLADLDEIVLGKRRPWHRAPVPLLALPMLAALLAGCLGDSDREAAVLDPVTKAAGSPGPAPVAVIEVENVTTVAQVGEAVAFDGSRSRGAIRFWAWSFGDHVTHVDTEPAAEHAYAEPGEYDVVLLVRDEAGRDDYDVRVLTVVDPHAPAAAPGGHPSAQRYQWDAPKYEDAFERVSASTGPVDLAYAGGLGGSWVHAYFKPDDAGMLLDALVFYQDFRGQSLCGSANAYVRNWTYLGSGHYAGLAEECGARAGVGMLVYVGLCVEYDGELRDPATWETRDGVTFGDKTDDCFQRTVTVPPSP